ncbi:ATP-binding cassette domain-containing protein [Microbacterium phyllosphaerae]|uniref:ATP-binding cassette domain-containing protein n=1 Tax=Microbacterium phyllosphaerae TaxID=124798 RepID=UPI00142D3FDD|nr:ATP-binding cassette domain-containing protein [Microbacterium phyllosphaerae]
MLDVNLELAPGDFCVILGENGVGKSTFFRSLLDLDNHEGVIRVHGDSPHGRIMGVLEHPMMYLRWTAAANLRYVLNDSKAENRPGVRALLDDHLLRKTYGKMSTGQRKLVLLAAVLASDADVILLDEFSNGLDQGSRQRVREVIANDSAARARTVVATGHDLSAFGELPTRVLGLHNTVFTDLTAEYNADKDLLNTYAKYASRNAA